MVMMMINTVMIMVMINTMMVMMIKTVMIMAMMINTVMIMTKTNLQLLLLEAKSKCLEESYRKELKELKQQLKNVRSDDVIEKLTKKRMKMSLTYKMKKVACNDDAIKFYLAINLKHGVAFYNFVFN